MVIQESYPIPAGAARAEIRVVNSRFIGSADYTPSVDTAKNFIAQVRADFPGATHHAYAYLIGYGSTVTAGMSDAGEPSGTAGRPMLAVLRGSHLGDVTVVVTRYFGGTLLGTGGLVHAYSEATKEVLALLPRTEHVKMSTLMVRVAYAAYAATRQVLEHVRATISDEDFATDVTLIASLPVTQLKTCNLLLASVTAGQAEVIELD